MDGLKLPLINPFRAGDTVVVPEGAEIRTRKGGRDTVTYADDGYVVNVNTAASGYYTRVPGADLAIQRTEAVVQWWGPENAICVAIVDEEFLAENGLEPEYNSSHARSWAEEIESGDYQLIGIR